LLVKLIKKGNKLKLKPRLKKRPSKKKKKPPLLKSKPSNAVV